MNHNDNLTALSHQPQELDYWLKLWGITPNQSDPVTKTSLEIIIRGLQAIKNVSLGSTSINSSSLWTALDRLAENTNDSSAFKEAGNAYLRDFRIGHVAKEHLERAKSLGCKDYLAPLIEAASAIVKVKGSNDSGVSEQRKGQQALSNAIRQSGKLSLAPKASEPIIAVAPVRLVPLPTDPKTCLERGMEAISLGSIDNAKRYLSSIPDSGVEPDDLWEAWTQLGELCYEFCRYDDAVFAYEAACDLFPDMLISQFNLGIGLQMALRYEEALDAYKRADSLQPNHPKVWCNIGSVFFLKENYGLSEAALRKTVILKPDYARAWDNLAAALGAQGKMEEALIACREAVTIRPDFPEANFKMAIIYFSQRQFEQALPCFAAAAAQPSLSFYTNTYLAMALAEQGNMMAAEKALQMASQADGIVAELLGEAWSTMGRVRLKMFEFKRAITSFQEACRLNPAISQHWLDLGLAHQFACEDDQASECFNRAMKLEAAA